MSEQYHIKLSEENTAKYCILTGDPGRVEKIASNLSNPRFVMSAREFTTWEGYILNEKVLVVSTGIGGSSASIAMEELANIGVEYFIRIGTCGGMSLSVKPGDIVVANSAIRMEGTSKEYLPIEFPAVADTEILLACKFALDRLNYPYHIGVVECKDSFYGQHNPDGSGVSYELKDKWSAWLKGGCLASEMESAALFTVAAVRKVRCGSLFHCVWNQELAGTGMPQERTEDTSHASIAVCEAIRILIEWHREKLI